MYYSTRPTQVEILLETYFDGTTASHNPVTFVTVITLGETREEKQGSFLKSLSLPSLPAGRSAELVASLPVWRRCKDYRQPAEISDCHTSEKTGWGFWELQRSQSQAANHNARCRCERACAGRQRCQLWSQNRFLYIRARGPVMTISKISPSSLILQISSKF